MVIPRMAFTTRANGLLRVLAGDVEVFPPFQPLLPNQSPPQRIKCRAIYDTGATHSTISPDLVTALNLPSIGATEVGVGGGKVVAPCYLVNIGLPNHVMFPMVRVTSMALPNGAGALIGMDILSLGDFSVTNHQGKTTFSFCVPSLREIDFVAEIEESRKFDQMHPAKIGLNDPCPCGSGKKYKKCHQKTGLSLPRP